MTSLKIRKLPWSFGPDTPFQWNPANRVMFEELLRRFPDLELATNDLPPLRPANFVVGIEALPVRFTPARREAFAEPS